MYGPARSSRLERYAALDLNVAVYLSLKPLKRRSSSKRKRELSANTSRTRPACNCSDLFGRYSIHASLKLNGARVVIEVKSWFVESGLLSGPVASWPWKLRF